MRSKLDQYHVALHEQQQEYRLLKDILVSRGVAFERELENRRIAAGMNGRQHSGSVGPSPTTSRPSPFANSMPVASPPTSYQMSPEHGYVNGRAGSTGGSTSGHTPQNHSTGATSPLIAENAIKQEGSPVADMPGIFEKDPQLGIDFILAYASKCH